jgi:sugar lactone lactonase YvrE
MSVIPRLRAELLSRVGGILLEGPVWDEAGGQVRFVDILAPRLHALDMKGGVLSSVDVGETVTAWIPWQGGGSALVGRSGVRLVTGDVATDLGRLAVPIEADVLANRSNDAKCDLSGRLWVGTMADDASPGAGALYRVDVDLGCAPILDDLTISNGMGWSADGRRMWFVDSQTRRIDELTYDPDTGEARERRPWVDTSAFPGIPDGLTVDAEDGVWVAMHDGGAVLGFDLQGGHVATVGVPVARPTSCVFAGPALDRLVITTAVDPGGAGGDVYVCEPGVIGTATVAFAGAREARA